MAWNLSHPGNLEPTAPHLTLHSTRAFLENAELIPPTMPAQDNENYLFTQVQAHKSHLLVLFIWEGSVMKSTSAC
jgi:hypothetical protein